jgi:hypothetical protein
LRLVRHRFQKISEIFKPVLKNFRLLSVNYDTHQPGLKVRLKKSKKRGRKMKKNFLKAIGGAMLTILVAALIAQVWVSAQEVGGNNDEQSISQTKDNLQADNDARALEGSWTAQVTFRDCRTGAALRTFAAHNTFMQGGTMQEFGLGSVPMGRSNGHGVWSYLSERRFYSAFQFFRFNVDGSYAGYAVARRYMEVDVTGNAYIATSTNQIYDASGNLISSGCATETATRFN